jgi:hypothetical protein
MYSSSLSMVLLLFSLYMLLLVCFRSLFGVF